MHLFGLYVSSCPFLTMNFEFYQDHGPKPGPELDNCKESDLTLLLCVGLSAKLVSTSSSDTRLNIFIFMVFFYTWKLIRALGSIGH